MKRLAIITTHPIQYNAPWFKLLAEKNKLTIKVFYTWGQLSNEAKFDPGFGKNITWDIPLLDGYEFTFVNNVSKKPGSHHFKGIDNPTLIKEIQEWNADTLLVFGWSFKSHLKILRFFKGKTKILFRGDSNLIDEKPGFSIKKSLRSILLNWVYRHIDFALYVGTANKQYYKRFGLTHNQLIFAPHAIDNDRFKKTIELDFKLSIGIAKDAFIFLFSGKFEDKKNPILLLNAFIKLNDPNAHLVLVGNGNLEVLLRARVKSQVDLIQNRVHFLPFQNQLDMPAIYRMADVLVLPSQGPGETWGLAVNEGMACSIPVLISDKCGCATDLIKEGINGYCFKNKDEADLLDKMQLLITDKCKTEKMGESALELIENWRYENICLAIETVA